MLDKNERQFFPGQDLAGVIAILQGALYNAGISLQQTAPNQWSGRGNVASWGMVPKVLVSSMPTQDGFFLDVKTTPDIEGGGVVLFIVCWVFFFPLAIILGFLGYQDWQNRQNQLSQLIWAPLGPRIGQPPMQPWGAPMPGGPR